MKIHELKGSDPVQSEVDGKVGIITLSRPYRRNAMDQGLVDGLKTALLRMGAEPEVRSIVILGADKGFCAGSDLKFISELNIAAVSRFEQECGDLGRLIGFIDKPVVAAVEGFAIGGGFTLATCCDLVVSSAEAKWSLPEVPIGWLTPWGIGSLVSRVGLVEARRLCFGLDTLNGSEAKNLGVADYVVDPGTAAAFARDLGGRLGELPPAAVRATKRFFSTFVMDKSEAMDFEANRLFSQNALENEAQLTLARFRAPKEEQESV